MPHNPFPDPAAVHPGEAAMLSAVLADLTDDLPKLVYADWLEERGDARGPFLREFTTAARNGGKLPKPKKLSKAWLDLTGISAVSAAREHELPISPDDLLRDALPALTFTSKRAKDKSVPVGASKFGGHPDVPAGFKWPEYGKIGPLAFLAQFNLQELSISPALHDLPRTGMLSAFYCTGGVVTDGDDVGGWRIFHFPETQALERQTIWFEPDAGEEYPHPHPCRLTFTEALALPNRIEFKSEVHREAYYEHVRGVPLGHMLLGHPRWYYGGPEWFVDEGRSIHRHLLTLDSDHEPGWMWSDSGLLYFCMKEKDLKAGRFDRTLFEFQCG